jgi:hypothetical protein
LRPGVQEYAFQNLDDGKYLVQARVDGEVIYGLGHGFFPMLDPSLDEPPLFPEPFLLKEFEIYGQILLRGEAVPGEVGLQWLLPSVPEHRAPTDDDLLYHLFYFGRSPVGEAVQALADLDEKERLGMYAGYYGGLKACTMEGVCRLFHRLSRLRGGGRLDLELAADREVEIQVVHQDTGEPIPRAEIFFSSPTIALHFDAGDVEWVEAPQREGIFQLTNTAGSARFLDLPAGEQPITVHRDGFTLHRGRLRAAPQGKTVHRVELMPETGESNLTLRFPDGRPVAGALLRAIRLGGQRVPHCSVVTNAEGGVRLSETCRAATWYLLLHPEAEITFLGAEELATVVEFEVTPAPSRPLRVRIVDEDGRPVAGASVELLYPLAWLQPRDFLAGLSRTGVLLISRSNTAGEIVLRGVNPADPETVRVLGSVSGEVSLRGYQAGETVEIPVHRR